MNSQDRFFLGFMLALICSVVATIAYGNKLRDEEAAKCRARGGEPEYVYRQGVMCFAPGMLR